MSAAAIGRDEARFREALEPVGVADASSRVIRVAVSGAAGRMGQTVCDAVEGAEDMELAGRADPALGTRSRDVLDEARPDVVVDFTMPDTGFDNARCASSAACTWWWAPPA